MASVNKVILLGRIGSDINLRYGKSGSAYVTFSLATSEKMKGEDGKYTEVTEWHNLVSFGKTAEIIAKYLGKGSLAYFEGKIKHDKYQDANKVEQESTKVVVTDVQFLDKKAAVDNNRAAAAEHTNIGPTYDEDVPF